MYAAASHGLMATRLGQVAAATLATLLVAAPLFTLPAPFSALAPIAIAMLPVAIVVAFRFPFILCLIFIIFSFFRIHEAFPALNPLRIPSLVAIPTLLVLGWHVLLSREIRAFWSRELKLLTVFFALVTVGVAFAINRPMALTYWTQTYWKIYVMALAIAWLVKRPQDFALAARAFIIAGSAISVVAISNKLAGVGLVEETRVTIAREMGSVLGDPNDLSLVLLFPLSFGVSFVVSRMGWLNTALGAGGAALMIWAIICTQSRGGLLGILTVFGVVGWRKVRSKFLLIGVGGAAALALFIAMGINKRASGGAHEEGIDESAMGRIYAWGAAWKMATSRPLTGVGLDNFVANYFFYSDHWDGQNHAVHSTWFNVLSETGFPGFLVFVALVVVCLMSTHASGRALQQARAPPAVQAMALALFSGLCGFAVAGTFLTQGFTWPIYILLALTAATGRYVREEIAASGVGAPNVRK
ncbi:MAG: O-antigen ligase family protein [Hyphomicrobiaceae bacterium]